MCLSAGLAVPCLPLTVYRPLGSVLARVQAFNSRSISALFTNRDPIPVSLPTSRNVDIQPESECSLLHYVKHPNMIHLCNSSIFLFAFGFLSKSATRHFLRHFCPPRTRHDAGAHEPRRGTVALSRLRVLSCYMCRALTRAFIPTTHPPALDRNPRLLSPRRRARATRPAARGRARTGGGHERRGRARSAGRGHAESGRTAVVGAASDARRHARQRRGPCAPGPLHRWRHPQAPREQRAVQSARGPHGRPDDQQLRETLDAARVAQRDAHYGSFSRVGRMGG